MIKLTKIASNFSMVNLDHVTVWFSYETPIAFQQGTDPKVVRKNDWSTTTGKHLNQVDGGSKDTRVTGSLFETRLHRVLHAQGFTAWE